MRLMVIVKATQSSEAGAPPSAALLKAMGDYNEKLVEAGVMRGGDGLRPSSFGRRVRFSGDQTRVESGPFPETEQLIAGFWIWEVNSMDEALEWARQCPNPMPGEEAVLELRPMEQPEDFGDALTPEERAREERLREKLASSQPRP